MVNEEVIIRADQPVQGVEVKTYVLLKDSDNKIIHDKRRRKQFRWFRSKESKTCQYRNCVLGAFKDKPALIENIFTKKRYCTLTCFKRDWKNSAIRTTKKLTGEVPKNNFESKEQELFEEKENEVWDFITEAELYIPTQEDVGHFLKVECAYLKHGEECIDEVVSGTIITPVVVPMPTPSCKRKLQFKGNKGASFSTVNSSDIRVVSYNILARVYATKQLYPYCPMWCLSWNVRKLMILRELLDYNADIICLQEVEEREHYGFFQPELQKHYYEGCYKAKTRGTESIDGCSIFIRKSKFRLIKTHEIEFNSIALSLVDTGVYDSKNKEAVMKRLLKDNIAQVLFIEMLPSTLGRATARYLCVVNTHIFWDPEYSDVKMWQIKMLVREVTRMLTLFSRTQQSKIPLILCGDFNSTPESAMVDFIKGQSMITYNNDPYGILAPLYNIQNDLNMQDAYETVGLKSAFTNYTATFKGVLDYIWISKGIEAISCMKIPDEKTLRGERDIPLPNIAFPSDHIALCANLVC